MGISNHFTRGGQLAMHRLRMFSQISITTVLIGGVLSLVFFVCRGVVEISPRQWSLYQTRLEAELLLGWFPHENPSQVQQSVTDSRGNRVSVSSLQVLRNPWLLRNKQGVEVTLKAEALWTFRFFLFSLLGVGGYFLVRGRVQSRKTRERGSQLVPLQTLVSKLKREGRASVLTLGALPLIRGSETSHLLVTGTTGSGKTNCFHTLLPQVRAQGKPAVILDLTGDFVARYFNPQTDHLLNPFDQRSSPWSLWKECRQDAQVDALAEALIPQHRSSQDPFWEEAARSVLGAALRKAKAEGKLGAQGLYHLLAEGSLKVYSDFFKGTAAASLTELSGDRMTLSIRANLVTHVTFLKYLQGDTKGKAVASGQSPGGFSIRDWIEAPKGWLFLTARADQRQTLKPFLSALMDTGINALLTLPPDRTRQIWFLIDELPALQRLPSLELALAESRKYGGCILAGIQSYPQLIHVYGQACAQSLTDLFNTKVFFRSTDPQTTQWISKVLGESETTQVQENMSYGANAIRDGVSLSQLHKQEALVLPTEIATLDNLSCYVKLPGNIPITKLTFPYQHPQAKRAQPFVERDVEPAKPANASAY
jgi:type IV conjugative transfer system coupling protein TraD